MKYVFDFYQRRLVYNLTMIISYENCNDTKDSFEISFFLQLETINYNLKSV